MVNLPMPSYAKITRPGLAGASGAVAGLLPLMGAEA